MFIRWFGHALVGLGALVALLGAAPSGPAVTIADGALTPTVVTVPAGGSVLWTNAGTRQHEIAAQNNAFPAFSLAPAGTHSVTFQQPGRYPYVLDGTVKGTVFVIRPGGGAGAGQPSAAAAPPASSATPPAGCVTVYRYDVRVGAHREQTQPGGIAGELKTLSDWKASWVAPVYVDRCAGVKMLITARSAETSKARGWPIYVRDGQFSRTFDYASTVEPQYEFKVPCHFTYASNSPAVMSVTALFSSTGKTTFDFLAGQDLRDSVDRKAEFERQVDAGDAACHPKHPQWSIITFNYTVIPNDGLPGIPASRNSTIGDGQFHLTFDMPPDSPVETSILDALVAGKGFNYDTGMLLVAGKAGKSERVRALISFSRLND